MNKSPRCVRCGGKMVYESLGPYEQFTGLKCIICGEVIDPVILQNRRLMKDGLIMISKEGGLRPKAINL